jgi:hypothetical protein
MGNDVKKIDPAKLEALKGIIKDLHGGLSLDEAKKRFNALVKDVDPESIALMEQELMQGGMPKEEIKRLCDVHVAIFKDALEKQEELAAEPGHPVHTFRMENDALGKAVEKFKGLLAALGTPPAKDALSPKTAEIAAALEALGEVNKHYLRKENQLFPFLEKHGIFGPSQVMWAIHDDVRTALKTARAALGKGDAEGLAEWGGKAATMVADMIYKEDHILFPLSLQKLTRPEWIEIRFGEDEIGYALIPRPAEWRSEEREAQEAKGLKLDTGDLSLEQVNLILTHLPFDVTFVDENDEVRYYSAGPDRIFPRSPGIIGRQVQNCHPPKSLDVVNRIVSEFKAGTRDVAEFWIKMGGRFIHIRYLAVRDRDKNYRGVVEVTQDVTGIRGLAGEKRLLDWEDKK